MSLNDTLTITAIITSPAVAVIIGIILEQTRQKRNRKLSIFRTLMATRADLMARNHIDALNLIDFEFYSKKRKHRKVVEAWKVYLDHLNDQELHKGSFESWSSKGEDLFIELLTNMANSLNYEYDKSDIKKTSYFPEGYGQQELDFRIIRKGLVDIFSGKAALPMQASFGKMDKKQKELLDLQIEFYSKYDADKTVNVKVINKENKTK